MSIGVRGRSEDTLKNQREGVLPGFFPCVCFSPAPDFGLLLRPGISHSIEDSGKGGVIAFPGISVNGRLCRGRLSNLFRAFSGYRHERIHTAMLFNIYARTAGSFGIQNMLKIQDFFLFFDQ
jgi:hypothetical protein